MFFHYWIPIIDTLLNIGLLIIRWNYNVQDFFFFHNNPLSLYSRFKHTKSESDFQYFHLSFLFRLLYQTPSDFSSPICFSITPYLDSYPNASKSASFTMYYSFILVTIYTINDFHWRFILLSRSLQDSSACLHPVPLPRSHSSPATAGVQQQGFLRNAHLPSEHIP